MDTIGPISFVSIHGNPTGIFFAFFTSDLRNLSLTFLFTRTREVELHDWPCLLKFIPFIAKLAAKSGSASSKIIIGFFPPSSRDIFFKRGAADFATAIPVLTDPIIAILLMSGCSTKNFPFSGPPVTTFIKPFGNTSSNSSQNLNDEIGACSEFFYNK